MVGIVPQKPRSFGVLTVFLTEGDSMCFLMALSVHILLVQPPVYVGIVAFG